MRITTALVSIAVLAVAGTASAQPHNAENAKAFFDKHVEMTQAYNTDVAKHYADDAEIRILRQFPDGSEETVEIGGSRWKSLVERALPYAKKKGHHSTFSDIQVSVNDETAKITADRRAVSRCFTDDGYYMVVEHQPEGGYKIVEEYSEAETDASCE